jgi:hypothetical protein
VARIGPPGCHASTVRKIRQAARCQDRPWRYGTVRRSPPS